MMLPPILASHSSSLDEIVLELEISVDLDAFQGHFPDHPILPGVVQIDWAVRLASLHLGVALQSARDFQVKFRNIIHPNRRLSLSLRIDRPTNRLFFTYMSVDMIMCSGHIKLGAMA